MFWMVSTLWDFGFDYKSVPLFCDNTSAISIANNLILHSRTKHIDVRYHFLRDPNEKGDIELQYVDIHNQFSGIFTKPLDPSRFPYLHGELGICHPYGIL
ncbi:hypothetical protein GUJ93_ZPchr0004g39169 [Zizania palustris]|uniref:Uncharacterized protein n=1 Tax=Zizania palustris TaxID=103762 RepID=A0A8J5V925_ZIZPA|nr:hypothetical protein GUJ93_ZPchr0004g39169 [Zizania palustris]